MTMTHSGIIVIWNDILPQSREDFLEWHSREHIPERVAIPGFQRGQRWFGETSAPQYLTIYSTTDPAVLTSAAYLERLNNPTPWTRQSVAAFRNTSRAAGMLAWQSSALTGGTILTARIDMDLGDSALRVQRWSTGALAVAARAGGVARIRVAVSSAGASRVATAERAVRVGDQVEPQAAILMEGFGSAQQLRAAFAAAALGDPILASARVDLYSLQFDWAG